MFVTVCFAVYHIDSGRLQYANGGHENLLLIGQETIRQSANPNNLALAIDPEQKYQSLEEQLAPGESVFLFTDGVTEARGTDGQLYGTARLHHFLLSNSKLQVDQLCKQLGEELQSYQSGEPGDDITMVLLRRQSEVGG
jgi:sigma-B regulation protein RsbU (phosphoserine phosphatase)